MPVSSMQISGLIGGQQAMFANNMAYSQQLSGAFGTGPAGGMQPMQNPYPGASYGYPGGWENAGNFGNAATQAVGMGASMAPIGMGAVSLGGMMAGGRMGWLDPFTGTARAFSAGSGGLGNIGSHVAAGRFGSAAARIGLGTAAGLATGGLYMAGAEAVTGAASSVYEGAQLVNDVSSMSRRFGPSFGTPGARPGGQMARGQIQGVVDVLHELASESVIASVTDVTKLLDRFSRMGQLTGITNAVDFKRRFSDLVKQVDSVAKVLGTSLEEAAPLVTSMRSMGMWRPSDIMGTAYAMRQVGPQAAPALMASMQTGAQQSWAQGGTLGAGAAMGRQTFMQVQAAGRMGVMNDQFITEMTGGTGGVEGQAMFAGQLTGVMSRFTQHPAGQLMMAALGEMKDGEFTGRMDEAMMAKFKSGQINVDELQRMGMGRVQKGGKGGRAAATSFMMRRSMMGQEMAATGGMEAMGQMVQQVIKRAGFENDSESVQARVLQNIYNVDEKMAYALARFSANLPAINDQNGRAARDNINDQFRELDRRLNHGFEGFKSALSKRMENMWRPFKEFGGNLVTEIASSAEKWFQSTVMGYQDPVVISDMRRRQILGAGGISGGAGFKAELQAAGIDKASMFNRDLGNNWIQAIRGDTSAGAMAEFSGAGRAAVGAAGAGEMRVGGKFMTGSDAELGLRRMALRGRSQSASSFGFDTDDAETKKHLITLKSEWSKMTFDPATARKLARAKELFKDNPAAYQQYVLSEMEKNGSAAGAIDALLRKKGSSVGSSTAGMDKMDILAAASDMAGGAPLATSMDWERTGELAGGIPRDPAKLTEMANKGVDEAVALLRSSDSNIGSRIAGATGGMTAMLGGIAAGAAIGTAIPIPIVGTVLGGLVAAVGIGAGLLVGHLGETGVLGRAWSGSPSDKALGDLLRDPDLGPALQEWLKSGGKEDIPGNKFLAAVKKGDKAANDIFNRVQQMPSDQKEKLLASARKYNLAEIAITQEKERVNRMEGAQDEIKAVGSMKQKLSGPAMAQYQKILELDSSGAIDQQEKAEVAALELANKASDSDIKALAQGSGRARQIAALAQTRKLRGGISVEQWRKQANSINRAFGYDIVGSLPEELQARIKAAEGDNTISQKEMQDIKGMISDFGSKAGGYIGRDGGKGGMSVEDLMTKYTSANTQFVYAVGATIAKMGGKLNDEAVIKRLDELKKGTNPSETPK